jgi:predicted ArsR family transcriptional regulator
MHHRTRQFLGLLAEDLANEILESCRAAPRSELELVKLTGISRATVSAKVAVLEARGFLERRTERTGAAGRPATRWVGRATKELDALAKAADTFVLNVLEGMASDHRAEMDRATED